MQQAQSNIDNLNEALALAEQKFTFNTTQVQNGLNAGETTVNTINGVLLGLQAGMAIDYAVAGIAALAERPPRRRRRADRMSPARAPSGRRR